MRQRIEYAPAWLIIKLLGFLPRPLARAAGIALAQLVYVLHPRLRSVGMRNLELAFPEKSKSGRAKILRGEFTSLGRQLAEVCKFPKYTLKNVGKVEAVAETRLRVVVNEHHQIVQGELIDTASSQTARFRNWHGLVQTLSSWLKSQPPPTG